MQPVYATRAQLVASDLMPASVVVPDDPEATRLLTRASRRVDKLLRTAIYPVDDLTGLPTEPEHVDALRDATCAQAAWWLETGDESGTAERYTHVAIGSVSLTRGRGVGAGQSSEQTETISPDAVLVLQQAGLIGQGPIVV